MFGRIAERYDLANRALSLGIDTFWRARLVDEVCLRNPRNVVDLATGSGDVAFELREALSPRISVTGLDFCAPMIDQAIEKRAERGEPKIDFGTGDILGLDLPSASVDAITISFGYRNLEDRAAGLKEIHRVLRPDSGNLYILEFSQPFPIARPFYYFYLKQILPNVAGLLTGDRAAYNYLCNSIELFPNREEISKELEDSGFTVEAAIPLTLGTVALHIASPRPEE